MNRMTLTLLALLAVVAMVAPAAPAVAARQVAGPVAETHETPVEELLRQTVLRGRDDPRARAEAMRAFVTQRWGLLDERPAIPGVEQILAGEPLTTEFNVWPFPTSDLDGDGGDDVLVNGSSYPDGPEVVEARNGTDGALLWRVESDEPVGAFAWPTGADMTGDGIEDVLVVARVDLDSTVTDTCVTGEVFNCTIQTHTTYVTTATLRSGATGEAGWTFSREGEEHFEVGHRGTPADYEVWQLLDASNTQVTPYLSGDHDGDGLPDLVVSARGLHWDDYQSGSDLLVAGEWSGHSYEQYDTESVIVSAATGAETAVRTVVDSTAAGDLRPLDQDGDALLWTAETRNDLEYTCAYDPLGGGCEDSWPPGAAMMEAVDGQSLETRWAVPIETGDTALPLGEDLNGDGVAELLVSGRAFVDGNLVEAGTVVDGASGQALWTRPGRWYPELVPSMDSGVGADVLFEESVVEGDERTTTIDRVDGATGEVLLSTSRTVAAEGADHLYLLGEPVGDVTGDGVVDLAWHTYRLDRSMECPDSGGGASCWFYRFGTDTEIVVEDGATGAVVMPTWSFAGYGLLSAAGDLDGDGMNDLMRLEAGEGPMVFRAVDGGTGEAGWTATFTERTTMHAGGDHDGDGRADLWLEATLEADGARTSFIGGVSGLDGQERWRVRYG